MDLRSSGRGTGRGTGKRQRGTGSTTGEHIYPRHRRATGPKVNCPHCNTGIFPRGLANHIAKCGFNPSVSQLAAVSNTAAEELPDHDADFDELNEDIDDDFWSMELATVMTQVAVEVRGAMNSLLMAPMHNQRGRGSTAPL